MRALLVALALGASPAAWGQGCTTTVTGTVTAPNGDVLPNILVYVPTTAVQPFAGQGPGPSCASQYATVSGNPLVATTTNAYGQFSLTNANLAGTQEIVIQAGKWRRQFPGISIASCQTTALPTPLAMPANQSQGDMPRIAISTGSADQLECVMTQNQMGISNTEFTVPGGGGSINLYTGSTSAGVTQVYTNGVSGATTALPSETTLMDNPATLNSYDLVMFACQGHVSSASGVVANENNLVSYANAGGRIFATHYNYGWLDKANTFASTAHWNGGTNSVIPTATGNGVATINQTLANNQGTILADWLHFIEPSTTLGQIALTSVKQDQTGVIAPTQSWATLNAPYAVTETSAPVMQLTFDTPLSATGTPTLVLSFTNTPANFLEGDAADTISIDVQNNSASPADASLTLSLTLPTGISAVSLVGTNASTGWACALSTLTCNRTAAVAAGASDPVTLTVSVASTAPIGNSTVSATLSGGGLSGTNQCGRVLFNEYHVESGTTSSTFPNECPTGAMTAQEKFLEFSLYDLSNFVAPVTTDQINVQALPLTGTLVAAPEPAPFEAAYTLTGTLNPIAGSSVQPTGTMTFSVDGAAVGTGTLNASDMASVTIAAHVPGGAGTPLLPGNHALSASYSGDSNYSPSSLSGSHTVSLAPTSVALTPSTPLTVYYGQAVDGVFVVSVVDPAYPASGTYTVYDNGAAVPICTNLPLYVGGAINPCPYGNPVLIGAGSHALSVGYNGGASNGDAINGSSISTALTYTVQPDITTTVAVSSLNPSILNQTVTFTATVAGNDAAPAGTVSFYDGTLLLDTATLSGSTATLATSNLSVGTHTITAVYGATANFLASTSAVLSQVVEPLVTPVATAIALTSSLNPAPVGLPVTLTAAVTTPGTFVEVPTGSVTFLDGTATLGTGTLNGVGVATFQTSTLRTGSHAITASYAGDSATGTGPHAGTARPASLTGTLPSVSAVLTEVVTAPDLAVEGNFAVSANPVPASVAAGQYAQIQVQVTEYAAFSAPVTLSCSGLPAETTCVFQTATMPAGGGSTILYVLPQGPHSCGTASTPYYSRNWLPMLPAGTLVATLGLVVLPKKRRRLRGLLLAALLAGAASISGCGTCTDLGVRPGSYSFTLTGTAQTTGTATVAPQTVPITVNVTEP